MANRLVLDIFLGEPPDKLEVKCKVGGIRGVAAPEGKLNTEPIKHDSENVPKVNVRFQEVLWCSDPSRITSMRHSKS